MRITKDTVPDISTFYKNFRPLVNSLLLKRGAKEEELEDLFQDVVLRVLETKSLEKYGVVEKGEYCASFKYYIYTIVRSVYINKKRQSFQRELLGVKGKKKIWSDYKQIDNIPLEDLSIFDEENNIKEIPLASKDKIEDQDLTIILDQFKKEIQNEHLGRGLTSLALLQYVFEGYSLIEVARLHDLKGVSIYGYYDNLRKSFRNFIKKKGLNATLLLGR